MGEKKRKRMRGSSQSRPCSRALLASLACLLLVAGAGCGGAQASPSASRTPPPDATATSTVRPSPTLAPSPSPAHNTFASGGSMQAERLNAALLEDGRVLMVGGSEASGAVVATAELYDPKAGAFFNAGSMKSPRMDPTTPVLKDRRVLVAGGQDGSSV